MGTGTWRNFPPLQIRVLIIEVGINDATIRKCDSGAAIYQLMPVFVVNAILFLTRVYASRFAVDSIRYTPLKRHRKIEFAGYDHRLLLKLITTVSYTEINLITITNVINIPLFFNGYHNKSLLATHFYTYDSNVSILSVPTQVPVIFK